MNLTNRLPESILQVILDLLQHYQKSSNKRLKSILTEHNQIVNGPLKANWSITRTIYKSDSEAEYAALYKTDQLAQWLHNVLEEMGYPQPPSIIFCDNAIANSKLKLTRWNPWAYIIINNNIDKSFVHIQNVLSVLWADV